MIFTQFQVSRIHVHPNYSHPKRYNNDIALIRLSTDIKFGKQVQPICLPASNSEDEKLGLNATVAGWGNLKDIGNPQSPPFSLLIKRIT